jgi:cytidylate kinase
MSGDVSKPRPASGWPFMAAPGAPNNYAEIRERALEILRREKRAIHSGELAQLLQVPTHQVHVVMQQPLVDRAVRFSSSEGWDIVAPYTLIETRQDDGQRSL